MLQYLYQVFRGYELYEVVIELAFIWVCVYFIYRFLRGTRGAGVIKGVAFLLIVTTLLIRVLGKGSDAFGRLNFLYDRLLGLLAILLIVVFQPELRQAMIQLGGARFFRGSQRAVEDVVASICRAVKELSQRRYGALIAIERSVKLGGLVEGGETLDARLSARLLESIFWPSNPLHDLGVVVRGNRIIAASVQYPLAEEGILPRRFGSRHRAAIGLTLESDCLVIIVSEQNGAISLAERGKMMYDISAEQLHDQLLSRLRSAGEIKDEEPPSGGSENDEVGTTIEKVGAA